MFYLSFDILAVVGFIPFTSRSEMIDLHANSEPLQNWARGLDLSLCVSVQFEDGSNGVLISSGDSFELIAGARHYKFSEGEVYACWTLSKDDYLALQCVLEQMDEQHATGRTLPGHYEKVNAVHKIMEASPWTLHPDHGCVLSSDVEALDRKSLAERV
jgi:hypothetical protein